MTLKSLSKMAGFQFLSGLVLFSVTVSVYSFIIGAPPDTCGNPTTFHTEPLNETHVGQYLAQNSSTAPYKVIIDTKFYENETYSKVLGKPHNRVRGTFIWNRPSFLFKSKNFQSYKYCINNDLALDVIHLFTWECRMNLLMLLWQ